MDRKLALVTMIKELPFDYVTCIVCHRAETTHAALHIESASVDNAWICPWCLDEFCFVATRKHEVDDLVGCDICGQSEAGCKVRHFALLRGAEVQLCRECVDAISADVDYDMAGFSLDEEDDDNMLTARQKLSLRQLNEWTLNPGGCECCHDYRERQLVRCKECGDGPWLCPPCDTNREHHHVSM
jgi:hypothetical protein